MQKLSCSELAELVKLIKQGDPDAFTTVYNATIKSQLYYAAAFLKDLALAEDAVQEVYLSVYRAIIGGKLSNPKLFVAYLNRTTYNTCVNFKKKYEKTLYELGEDALAKQPDTRTASNPDEWYDAVERGGELHRAISALPDQLRSVFLLRFYSELRIREIASLTGFSERTVKRNIRAAKDRLKLDRHLFPPAPQLGRRLSSLAPQIWKRIPVSTLIFICILCDRAFRCPHR
jgi:RNA polymerase sigma factor (sigma-70 family)